VSENNLNSSCNLLPFWQDVQEFRRQITEDVAHITSVTYPGSSRRGHVPGIVFMVNREIAARHLASGSHRFSTPEEIAAYEEDFNRRTEASRASAAAARGTTQVSLSPDSLAAILGRKKKADNE